MMLLIWLLLCGGNSASAVRLVPQFSIPRLWPEHDSVSSSSAELVTPGLVLATAATSYAIWRWFRRSREQPTLDTVASPPPGRDRIKTPSARLASREFARDMARLAEHIVMYDVTEGYWDFDAKSEGAAEALQLRLNSREQAPFFAPDKVGSVGEKSEVESHLCPVRWQRARWAIAFKEKYDPHTVAWIDTGVSTQKPALVLLLWPDGRERPPLITVAFRGSKTYQDYFVTDASPSFIPVPLGDISEKLGLRSTRAPGLAADESERTAALAAKTQPVFSAARWMWSLARSESPCTTLGAWRAYAGDENQQHAGASTPRLLVRKAVESLLEKYPEAQIVLTGHSLGGALSTLCAFDLLAQSEAVRAACPLTLLTFAAPRLFNQAFQDGMSRLARTASGRRR
jgi:hypothetical protein